MKLLFDENLSPRLPEALAGIYPQSSHLRSVGLKGADDAVIWEYAATHRYAIVSKDDDFRELSVLRGAPPKLIMIGSGNCSTDDVVALLRTGQPRVEAFGADTASSILELP